MRKFGRRPYEFFCEDCIDVCMEEAITKRAYKVIIDPDKCDSCGECVDVCPVGAIYEE